MSKKMQVTTGSYLATGRVESLLGMIVNYCTIIVHQIPNSGFVRFHNRLQQLATVSWTSYCNSTMMYLCPFPFIYAL